MADNTLIKLAFPGADGKKVPVELTLPAVRQLIAGLLRMAAMIPTSPDLDRQLILDDNPIPSNGFMVTPLEGDPNGAHVSIGIGAIDLQFAISLPALMQALEGLKGQTELDPKSSLRPN